ncbi:hypothetical protein TH8_10115 [Thalassospira profundimaris]|nr:hypothetical protein TH8_10115 [Thalassospira profundimaris]
MRLDRGAAFAQHIKRILGETKTGIRNAAAGLGMDYHKFYSRLSEGRVVLSADEIAALIKLTGRREIVDYLLDGSRFIAIERFDDAPSRHAGAYATHGQIQHGANTNVYVAAEILREVDQALLDNKIDHRDRARILEDVHNAEVALASLRAHLSPPGATD